jgi:fructan beta-fructosidase
MPSALYIPDEGQAFSGTATVDPKNTSEFRRNGIDPLIAFYTRTGSGEHIALSYDNGRTFEEYPGNPVVQHTGRDPKVFWYEPGSHWVMAVYDERPNARPMALGQSAQVRGISIYTSPNLKDWTYQSTMDGFFECPELFEISVDGEPWLKKWIMYDADGKYIVGDFDGKQFKIEQPLRQYDFGGGGNFYASQTFANIPEEDGRRIQVGWLRGITTPGMPFNQSMGFPTQLKLRRAFDGWRLTPTPIREISALYADSHIAQERVLASGEAYASAVTGDTLHVIAEFDPGDARQIGLNINGYRFVYNRLESKVGPFNYVPPSWDDFKIEAIVDRINIQIFVNDGEMYLVVPYDSIDAEKVVEVFADMRFPGSGRGRGPQPAGTRGRGIQGGARVGPPTRMVLPRTKAILKRFEVHALKTIWEMAP